MLPLPLLVDSALVARPGSTTPEDRSLPLGSPSLVYRWRVNHREGLGRAGARAISRAGLEPERGAGGTHFLKLSSTGMGWELCRCEPLSPEITPLGLRSNNGA